MAQWHAPTEAKNPPTQISRLNGPLDLFTVSTRFKRASILPCGSPAKRTFTVVMLECYNQ